MVNRVAGEWNFDGIAGPTHFFGGMGSGNIFSQRHRFHVSHPRAAALQCLDKMAVLCRAGVPQGIWPPAPRPHLKWLRRRGFSGSETRVWEQAWSREPESCLMALSSSFMWTANAATVSPFPDCADGNTHVTPANLIAQAHRRLEVEHHQRVIQACFGPVGLCRHDPLPADDRLADEGAANHMRLAPSWSHSGLEIFVYGRDNGSDTVRFHPRQTAAASRFVAKRHGVVPERVLLLRQNPLAVDAGVFHNDVIALNHEDILIAHEHAYDADDVFDLVRRHYRRITGEDLRCWVVRDEEMSLREAVETYVFNSQLVTTATGGKMLLLARPLEPSRAAERFADSVTARFDDIETVRWVDLSESLRNGGGPACLRLRVVLKADQAARVPEAFVMDEDKIGRLREWVNRRYRDRLTFDDLKDPQLIGESFRALDELTRVIGLGGDFYDFQRG